MKTFDVQVDTVLVATAYVPVEAENEEEAREAVTREMALAFVESNELFLVDFQVINVEKQ